MSPHTVRAVSQLRGNKASPRWLQTGGKRRLKKSGLPRDLLFAAAEVRGGPKKFKKSHVTVISPSYPDHPPLEVVIEWVRLATPAPASCDLRVNVRSLIRAWLTECEHSPTTTTTTTLPSLVVMRVTVAVVITVTPVS